MVLITIVIWAYKPTYNWGAYHGRFYMFTRGVLLVQKARHIQDLRVLGDLPQGGAHHHRQVDLAQGTAVEHRIEA